MGGSKPPRRVRDSMVLKSVGRGEFALVSPLCARERQEDLDEVHAMIDGDELDIARDELLYLVADCHEFFEAHNLLAEVALLDGHDLAIARGHFGYVFETALKFIPPGFQGRLPTGMEYNAQLYLAGRGLARCLVALGDRPAAREVLERLAALDPHNADVRALLDELRQS